MNHDVTPPGELAALRAENARLRAALRPFADAYDIARNAVAHPITANHLRAIAAYELSWMAFHRAGIVLADCAALENSHD